MAWIKDSIHKVVFWWMVKFCDYDFQWCGKISAKLSKHAHIDVVTNHTRRPASTAIFEPLSLGVLAFLQTFYWQENIQ